MKKPVTFLKGLFQPRMHCTCNLFYLAFIIVMGHENGDNKGQPRDGTCTACWFAQSMLVQIDHLNICSRCFPFLLSCLFISYVCIPKMSSNFCNLLICNSNSLRFQYPHEYLHCSPTVRKISIQTTPSVRSPF